MSEMFYAKETGLVEVVRCRDCKHCVPNPKKVWGICYRHGVFVKPMDYCSRGKRVLFNYPYEKKEIEDADM